MNTADLADRVVAADPTLTKAKAKDLLDKVLGEIRDAAIKGEEISLPGFGKFKVQDKPARQGRNPRTGETMEIAATKKLVFQPAKPFKDALAK